GWNQRQLRQSLASAKTFRIAEEKKPVLQNWPAQRRPKRILPVLLPSEVVERIAGVEDVVSKKFPHVAVKLVRARLDDRIHYRPIAAPELRAVGVGLNFEFRQRIHRRLNHISAAVQHIAQVRIVVDAIELKIV